MATLKATILQNFATIGIPDFEEQEPVSRNWSIVGLSENLIDEERLTGLQHLNTRRLDLVIHNGSKFAFLNLQAFKIFDCEVATNTIRQCLTHYLTPDGNLLFGVQPSGDVVVLTDGLQKTKQVRKPAFIKLQEKQSKWYEDIPGKLAEFFGSSKSKTNQVFPELQSVKINGGTSTSSAPSAAWLQTSSLSSSDLPENHNSLFPYLTSLLDGLALLCAFSPTDCYIFLSSYETVLRTRSIANIKGSQVPGRWFRIIMHKSFIEKWLSDRKTSPVFEARLCYKRDEDGETVVGGALLYGALEQLRLELVYGIIKRRVDKFTLSWEMLQFDVDWALRESDGMPYSFGADFVAKLSSDCTKIALVISNHLGMYVHVHDTTTYADSPIQLKRQRVSLCNHSDYDGCHFYKKDCWISDVQWLVEDAYFAVMTLCGSLSIFYSSGEPMIVKVRKPGPDFDEDKSARFYFPVFHPHQIITSQQQCQRQSDQPEDNNEQISSSPSPPPQKYPTVKWIDSEQVLTCSSGMKIELFSIQRVTPIKLEQGQSEIWLDENKSDVLYTNSLSRRKSTFVPGLDEEEYPTASFTSFASSRRSSIMRPLMPDLKLVIGQPPPGVYSGNNNNGWESLRLTTPILQYTYTREETEGYSENNDYNPDYNYEEDDGALNPINDVESPSRIEELPPDGGEVLEENLENSENMEVDAIPTPEKLRLDTTQHNNNADMEAEKHLKKSEIRLDTEFATLSMQDSLARVNDYDDQEYSDGSSEPDVGPECDGLAAPTKTPLEQYCSLPDIGADGKSSSLRKRSQQYMADDEADEEEDETNNSHNIRRTTRRKSLGKASFAFLPGRRAATRSAAVILSPEESDHQPRSSSAYDTEYSQETYSSPFSYAPTTAEEAELVVNDHRSKHSQTTTEAVAIPETAFGGGGTNLVAAARSQSSTTTVSLQIPPVPKISGVIVPSERQSDVLMQNIQLAPTTTIMQPELMRYKPPPTTTSTATEPCNIDIIHFKSKAVGVRGATSENVPPSREETAEDYYAYDGEEEEDEEDQEEDDEKWRSKCSQFFIQ